MRRRRRARRYLALLAALALLVALFYRFRLTPLIKELAVTEVENQASDVISDAVGAQIADGSIDYTKIITLENDKIKLHISTLGGRIVYVDLKEYRTHDSLPLVLWKNGETAFGMNFYARNQEINTEKFFFTPSTTETTLYAQGNEQVLSMRLYADSSRYLEYLYKLAPDSYMTGFSIITHNMGDVIASNSSFLTLFWGINMPQLEKSKDFEKNLKRFV